jgi:hypothetical protein
MSRYLRCRFLLFAALAFLLSPQLTIVFAAQAPVRGGIFSIRLESNKAVYRLGERIELRVTLRNNTAQPYAIIGAPPPYGLCDLLILNSRRQPLSSKGSQPYREISIGAWEFPPGKSTVAVFSDPASKWSVREWADIKYWGYDLNQPGHYTIFALPTVEAFEKLKHGAGPSFITSTADKSNAVHIEILR